ncbi:zf-HC2 domain-containing protein [Myxococcota bacterium]|nr:zf-HC2 domain-containing protein [Myxococcota bacterium]MBU1412130.1 zf-HC2 domain-containing protein [Myxococcota bacterium]MBU1510364.1 zf-HC2 domain-containing protein [Myxococcota bacterium]
MARRCEMTRDPNLPEELLSAYLDGECTDEERARVEAELETSPEARALLDNMRQLRGLLQDSGAEPPGFRPVDLGAFGFGAPVAAAPAPAAAAPAAAAAAPAAASSMLQIDRETLASLLADRDRMHHRSLRTLAWTAALSGIAGMAVALIIGGFFFWSAMNRQPAPRVKVVNPGAPQMAQNPPVTGPMQPQVTQVGVKTPMIEPVPELEALTMASNTCIIENINSADDINTAVFQIPDADGEMITVIWLSGLDSGSTI